MIILWIRKRKTSERTRQPENNRESFQKHDESMKSFSLSHPKIESARPKDIMTVDGNVLASIQNVKMGKHTQN
jgi:hypothetical protein